LVERWEPVQISEIDKKYGRAEYAKIIDDEHGLRIELVFENDSRVRFLFETSVLAYNVCDEGRRLKTLNFFIEQYGLGMFGKYPVYIVENSGYIKWFNEECYDAFSKYTISHYVFVTSTDIIDILTTYAPQVSVIH